MNNRPRVVARLAALALVLLASLSLLACGGGDAPPPPPPPPAAGSATLGTSGGTVDGPDGVRLVIPADAVSAPTTFRIARDDTGAPPLVGINAVSPIYAVTPHGQAFSGTALLSIPRAATARVPAGERLVLLKANPGGNWRVLGDVGTDPSRIAVDLDGLSFFVLGACTAETPTWTIGAIGCPANHTLSVTVLDENQQVITVPRGPNGTALPVWVLDDAVQSRIFRLRWTRPAGTNRNDTLSVFGLGIQGITTTGLGSSVQEVNESVDRLFTVTIDPARVAGASAPGGVLRRVQVQAEYSTPVRNILGQEVFTGFVFNLDLPILIRSSGQRPVIVTQPANVGVTEGQPATFTVTANVTPAAPLNYQWFRRANANASFAPIAGATSAGYTLPAAALADDGAQFRVDACASPSRCTTSDIATLSVTRAAVAPGFTVTPADITVVAGQTASFTAAASGVPLPSIAWQSAPANEPTNFTAVTGAAGCAITTPPASGTATTATCTVGPLTTADSGRRYRAVATNPVASATSGVATLSVTPAPTAPSITQQPAARTTTEGGSASFMVTATGTAPLAYGWRLNGTALPAANGAFTLGTCTGQVAYAEGGATVTLSNLTRGCDGAAVSVVVSNGIAPNATSNSATLTVNAVSVTLSLLAGAIGGPGWVDGPGGVARVSIGTNHGIAFAANGTAYFTDASNRLRRMSATGEVATISDGLLAPSGVAVDAAGNIYVAERFGHRITRFTPAGASSVYIGSTQGDVDGTGAAARLSNPQALAIDAAGNLYFTQEAGDGTRKLRRVTPALAVSTLFTFAAGQGAVGIAVEPDGSAVYGTGLGGLFNTVIRISGGSLTVLAGAPGQSGDLDGTGSAARFLTAQGITRATSGDLYVTDLSAFSIRRVTMAGVVTRVSGSSAFPVVPADGVGSAGRYESPAVIGAAPDGSLLVGDTSTLRRLTVPGYALTTVAGRRLERSTVDETAAAARFRGPIDLVLDTDGTAYVADIDRIRRVTPAGVVSTLALVPALSIARAPDGSLVAASENAVWRVTTAGASTLIAGQQGDLGYVDGSTDVARFNNIGDVAVDASGNIFVTEVQLHTVRRIGTDGIVSTWAGAQGAPGRVDGARNAARFDFPFGLAIDGAGALYVTDTSNQTVRRIAGDSVATVAGSAPLSGSADGVGSAARFFAPLRLAFDNNGNLLIADTGNRTVRRMSPSFAVTTVLGTAGVPGVRLGNQPQLNSVLGLAVRGDGRLVLTSEGAVLEAVLP